MDKKRKKNKLKNVFFSCWLCVVLVVIWQLISTLGILPAYMLPSPVQVVKALFQDFFVLCNNGLVTVCEALIGLVLGIVIGSSLAVFMDASLFWKKSIMPLLLVSQTIPSIALAPLLVLWFGYGVLPKILLIFLTCFFPITIGLLGGLQGTDVDAIQLMEAMGANKKQIYWHLKLPGSLPTFFSSLRIAAAYSLVGAVVAEWLGGDKGLGVYMTRVRKSYSFDKMFAVILVISVLSLVLVKLVDIIAKKVMPWENPNQ